MGNKDNILINPAILKWARESLNLSIQDVAKYIKKDYDTVHAWEEGVKSPTYIQMEKLAYHLFKRPLALFFFPNPPEEERSDEFFRTISVSPTINISSDTMLAIRQAKSMRLSLYELKGNEPRKNNLLDLAPLKERNNPNLLANDIRKITGISIENQIDWKDSSTALKAWRNALQDNGIFIFKRHFNQKHISGFCLYDKEFPIVYLNNSKSFMHQIFTLFHELGHLLLSKNDLITDESLFRQTNNEQISNEEYYCNEFASEFLLPSEIIKAELESFKEIGDNLISEIADKYSVSREMVLLKLFHLKKFTFKVYTEKVIRIKEAQLKHKKRSGGGDYYATQATYLGKKYLQIVFGKYYEGKIGDIQLAEYCNIKTSSISGLEKYAYNDSR